MIKNTIDYYSVLNIAKINYLSQIHKHLIQKNGSSDISSDKLKID